MHQSVIKVTWWNLKVISLRIPLQLKGHKKGRSFGPNLKKMVCQRLINHYWSKYVFITGPSRNAYIFTPVIIYYSLP